MRVRPQVSVQRRRRSSVGRRRVLGRARRGLHRRASRTRGNGGIRGDGGPRFERPTTGWFRRVRLVVVHLRRRRLLWQTVRSRRRMGRQSIAARMMSVVRRRLVRMVGIMPLGRVRVGRLSLRVQVGRIAAHAHAVVVVVVVVCRPGRMRGRGHGVPRWWVVL